MKFSTLLYLLLFVFLLSCRSYNIGNENFVYHYSAGNKLVVDDVEIVHKSENQTSISLNLNSGNVLFVKESENSPLIANLKIAFYIVSLEDTRVVLDSLFTTVMFPKDGKVMRSHNVQMQIADDTRAMLKIEVVDLNSRKKETHLRYIEKFFDCSSQFFDFSPNEVNSSNFASPHSELYFNYYGRDVDNMKVYYFSNDFPIAAPPFQFENVKELDIQSDSVFGISKIDGNLLKLSVYEKGLYFVSSDSSLRYGFTLLCVDNDFPNIATASEMIPPLRYICSKNEYSSLLGNANSKSAVDDFWLKIGTYEDRASKLIANYYSRVIFANKNFSSYTEGWKTDRGMIYIVLGCPNYVYRDNFSETWVYGESQNFYSTNFTFKKIENKFSNNDFFLLRTPNSKEIWLKSVDSWRK